MAAIIVASWALIRMKGWFPRGSVERAPVSSLHEQLGIAVLLLLAVRLPSRWPACCRGALASLRVA